jgi:hypothetical protein
MGWKVQKQSIPNDLDIKKDELFILYTQKAQVEKLISEIEISGDIAPLDIAVIKKQAYSHTY